MLSKQIPVPSTPWTFFCFFLWPYRWYLLGLVVGGGIWGISVSLGPFVLKLIIDRLAQAEPNQLATQSVLRYVLGFCGIYLVSVVNFRFIDWLKLKFTPELKRDIVINYFSYVTGHSRQFFQNHFAGSLSSKVFDLVNSIGILLGHFDEGFANFWCLSFALVTISWVNLQFGVALLLWFILFMLVSVIWSYKITDYSATFAESVSRLTGKVVDGFTNIDSVHLFARRDYEHQRITESLAEVTQNDKRMLKHILIMRSVQDIPVLILIPLLFYILLTLYRAGKVSVGDFAFVIPVCISVTQIVWFFVKQFTTLFEQLGKCRQALAVLTTAHAITDRSDAPPLRITAGNIEFNQVTFRYHPDQPLFENFNLCLASNKKVGLVGYSGSGKSTLVHLLLRNLEPQQGEIYVDGQAVDQVTLDSLRQHISMVPQQGILFHRTLEENIKYGNPNCSDEQFLAAAKAAHCHEFIQDFPAGYASMVGERGVKLSGGQRQRIAIAQVILENAKILILDEATSALDSVTERLIQDNLRNLMAGKTCLVIAHRLSTLLEMDEIVVLSAGKIIEQGPHQALIANGGQYAKMWAMQSQGFLPEYPDNKE